MADIKINPGFACEVGDIFEYPETGEYEKLRGNRIVVLEKGKGCNPDHTYSRVLCFRPNVESDSFHFSCTDRYMDMILEHWRFVGHMDISMITNPDLKAIRKETKNLKWEVAEDDWPEIKKSLEDAGMIVEEPLQEERLYDDKESLDKINSALSNCVGYNDLVLRVKVDDDQIKHTKIGEGTIEFKTVDKNIRELQKENESLKEEIDILKKKIEQHENDNDIWRQGWHDCLKSLGYYLNS